MTELLAAGGCWNAMRFALDESGGATRNWLAPIETNLDMTDAQQLILGVDFDGDDMNIATDATFKIQWRNVSDSGSFTDLAATGEIKWATSSLQMTNNATIVVAEVTGGVSVDCTGKTWTTLDSGSKEIVAANGITQTVDDDVYFELHWAIALDSADSANGDQYEFRVTESGGTVIGTSIGKLTVKLAGKVDGITKNKDRTAAVGSVKLVLYNSDGGSPPVPTGSPVGVAITSNSSTGVYSFTNSVFSTQKYFVVGEKTSGGIISDCSPELTAVAV